MDSAAAGTTAPSDSDAPAVDWPKTLAALQRGDRPALARITRLITGYLARYGAYDLRDSWDDVVQEVLIDLIRSARKGSLREVEAFVGYTGSITRNRLSDWVRKHHKGVAPNSLGDPEVAAALASRPEEAGQRTPDVLLDLRSAMDGLPERERDVIVALYIEGHRYEDAAERLELPLGTLKRLQTAGLKKLRKKIVGDDDFP